MILNGTFVFVVLLSFLSRAANLSPTAAIVIVIVVIVMVVIVVHGQHQTPRPSSTAARPQCWCSTCHNAFWFREDIVEVLFRQVAREGNKGIIFASTHVCVTTERCSLRTEDIIT